ncbi:BrnA antitoxin family protein [Rhodoferax sp.]|uniref:BrnA antitoxin family protein n=1 Tax=Rhodoferax sp. TaxID=50421 RepID=UPI0025EF6D9A|nr:BrnA antitoxin family protein [Rhodoferax sp.]
MQAGKKPTESKSQGSDWERVKREAAQDAPIPFTPNSEPYDPNDAAAVATYWASAAIKRGRGRPAVTVKRPTLNMRVDAEVLDAFKATGPGWQTRINEVLKSWVQSHA